MWHFYHYYICDAWSRQKVFFWNIIAKNQSKMHMKFFFQKYHKLSSLSLLSGLHLCLNLTKNWRQILCWFARFVQIVNMKLFLGFFDLQNWRNNFLVHNLYNTRKSTKNQSLNSGSIEIVNLSRILSAVNEI